MNLFGRRAAMVSVSLLLTAASPGPLQAQRPPAEYPLLAVPKADTVFLYLTERPPLFGGFVVDRTGPEGQEIRLTEAPVRRIRDPSSAAVTLGRELERVRTGVRATSDAEILRRLDSDPFLGGVFSLLLRPVARVMGRLYVDTTAVPGQAYTYRATLTDADGVELDSTFEASVAVRDVSPAPPTAVDAEASDARAHLTWEYPPYTGEQGDYTIGFHVERSGDQGPFRRLTDLPIVRDDLGRLEYYDDDARNGTTYRYRVVAVGIAGRESEPVLSPPVTPIDETAPTPPTGLEIQVGDGQALLVWQLPPELDVAGFHVERAPGLNEPFQRLNPQLVPAQSPRWLDTTAVGATRYFYRVLAVDSAGNESRPSSGAMAVVDDRTAPAPPDSVRVEVVDRRLRIRWTPSPSPDVKGYHVWRGPARDRLVRLNEETILGTEYVDSGYADAGLDPGGSYLVHVVAMDFAENTSEPAVLRPVIPDAEAPEAPSGMRVTNQHGRFARILWSASPSRDVAFYELTRIEGDSSVVLARSAGGADREVRDTAVVEGRTYVYELVAADSADNRSPPVVDTLRFRDFTPPPAPRFARASPVDEGGIEILWERVVDDELVGYHVYRSEMPTGRYDRITDQPVTGLRFVDPGGRPGHFYVVKAVDRSGNESRPSDPVTGASR